MMHLFICNSLQKSNIIVYTFSIVDLFDRTLEENY